jgi:hypothetical protein
VKALPRNPYDGHALATVLPEIKRRSARRLPASSPTAAIAATTLRPTCGSRPEAWRHRRHQARVTPALGRRARHRPRQGRAPDGPKLSSRRPRRRRQRRPRRCRLQLPKAAGYNFRRLLAWVAALWRVFILTSILEATRPYLPEPFDATTSRDVLHGRLIVACEVVRSVRREACGGTGRTGRRFVAIAASRPAKQRPSARRSSGSVGRSSLRRWTKRCPTRSQLNSRPRRSGSRPGCLSMRPSSPPRAKKTARRLGSSTGDGGRSMGSRLMWAPTPTRLWSRKSRSPRPMSMEQGRPRCSAGPTGRGVRRPALIAARLSERPFKGDSLRKRTCSFGAGERAKEPRV